MVIMVVLEKSDEAGRSEVALNLHHFYDADQLWLSYYAPIKCELGKPSIAGSDVTEKITQLICAPIGLVEYYINSNKSQHGTKYVR